MRDVDITYLLKYMRISITVPGHTCAVLSTLPDTTRLISWRPCHCPDQFGMPTIDMDVTTCRCIPDMHSGITCSVSTLPPPETIRLFVNIEEKITEIDNWACPE